MALSNPNSPRIVFAFCKERPEMMTGTSQGYHVMMCMFAFDLVLMMGGIFFSCFLGGTDVEVELVEGADPCGSCCL